ncbi:MAG: hypothetical protein M1564_03195 [Candidatus Marsarchaeota archaeon]|jgi:translation elongation factor EF-1beta|nr:hypothetical protein [Candidatus Marsarchaeota archaeon]MCL5431277.1 hypothetical protein [Candidatus Marsarchaeota archaeon]
MSKVAVIFKIYPKENSLDEAKKEVSAMGPKGLQVEDVAFGIMVIKAMFVFEDSEDSSSALESKLKKLGSVSEVEVDEETLI